MKTDQLRDVLSWIKTTDLVEVSFKRGEDGFSLSSAESPAAPAYPAPSSRFTPVCAPCVGLFQWNAPGKARVQEEGAQVSEGELLGLIETVKGKTTPVKAPSAGRLARVMIDAGAAVEYGQPLFFVEPR